MTQTIMTQTIMTQTISMQPRAPALSRSLSRALFACTAIAVLLTPPTATASDESPVGTARIGDLVLTQAWTRQTPPRAIAGGGYLTIANEGREDDVLIGGSVDFADRVEIHAMSVTDGVMRMAGLPDGLPIPAGETVALEPGGYHVMFMAIAETPRAGETVPVTLTFARTGDVTVIMPVSVIGGTSPFADGAHGAADHGSTAHGDGTPD